METKAHLATAATLVALWTAPENLMAYQIFETRSAYEAALSVEGLTDVDLVTLPDGRFSLPGNIEIKTSTTGDPIFFNTANETWLAFNGPSSDYLIMRPDQSIRALGFDWLLSNTEPQGDVLRGTIKVHGEAGSFEQTISTTGGIYQPFFGIVADGAIFEVSLVVNGFFLYAFDQLEAVNDITYAIHPTPHVLVSEPSTSTLLALGFIGLGWIQTCARQRKCIGR